MTMPGVTVAGVGLPAAFAFFSFVSSMVRIASFMALPSRSCIQSAGPV